MNFTPKFSWSYPKPETPDYVARQYDHAYFYVMSLESGGYISTETLFNDFEELTK